MPSSKKGNFDLKDVPRSGHLVEFDKERLYQLLYKNSRPTTWELAKKMNCSYTAIKKHLPSMVKVQKHGTKFSHALRDNNKNPACKNLHWFACSSPLQHMDASNFRSLSNTAQNFIQY
ncbi:histone-lysine N-methyltransferase SETMAR [Trichonephila clavata]|uniref:Histone-lysine N-methyltransferase SETMAR n=1 Tax=Trichonephila clavata TaxID=2740835 RepID=A0A8X6KGC9_TRICU|nr:histone-lysine N-methyltransferase SETMAR [Trichonephila clavata]